MAVTARHGSAFRLGGLSGVALADQLSSVKRTSCADKLPVDLVVQLFAADAGRDGHFGAPLCGHPAHLEPVLYVLTKHAVPNSFCQLGWAAVERLDGSLNA